LKRLALLLLLWPVAAAAHPIEPLVTGSPMPVPGDMAGAEVSYSALHGEKETEQEVEIEVAAGVGGHAEIAVGGSLDAAAGEVGAAEVGAKVLVLMEGPTGIDLALAGRLSSEREARGSLLVGRSLAPGFYLQARVTAAGAPGAASGEAAAALQWSPIPRLLPTLEAQVVRDFKAETTAAWIVPEILWLPDINHLSFKLGVPMGLHGDMDVGMIAAVVWQG
jgi:hypothetical protein